MAISAVPCFFGECLAKGNMCELETRSGILDWITIEHVFWGGIRALRDHRYYAEYHTTYPSE